LQGLPGMAGEGTASHANFQNGGKAREGRAREGTDSFPHLNLFRAAGLPVDPRLTGVTVSSRASLGTSSSFLRSFCSTSMSAAERPH
jgi:hypothetical protein